MPKQKYVFVYELVAKSSLNIRSIKKWAEERNFEVVYVTGHGKITNEKCVYATIPEWIALIANAEYVITNSFHGTVFSLLFHRQVAVYLLNGYAKNTNSRIKTLEYLCGQELVANNSLDFEKILNREIDWMLFEKNKEDLRKIGFDFLHRYLDFGEN